MKASRSGLYLFWYGIIVGPSLILCSYLRVDETVTLMFTKAWFHYQNIIANYRTALLFSFIINILMEKGPIETLSKE